MATVQAETDNVATVRRGFDAFSAGDMAALTKLFHPNATWHSAPTGVLGGDRVGRDDVFSMFGLLAKETQGTFKVTPTAFAGSGDQVFVHTIARGSRNGRTIESDEVLLFTVAEGQVKDVRFYMLDYPANVDFWR